MLFLATNNNTAVINGTMQTSNQNQLSNMLATQIDNVAKFRAENAPFDKTYLGVIVKANFDKNTKPDDKKYNQYTIRYNGTELNFYINDGNIHNEGEVVRVHIPRNSLSARYVEIIKKKPHPYKIRYDEVDNEKDTITEFRCTNEEALKKHFEEGVNIDEKYIVKSVYTLVIKNKGTETEEVTRMIFPDESIMEIEGF